MSDKQISDRGVSIVRSVSPKLSIFGVILGISVLLTACSSSSTALPNAKTSQADISHAYSVLFDLSNPSVAPKIAVVQDGSSIKSSMAKELSSPLAKEASGATVNKVKILSASQCKAELLPNPCASVSYTITLPSLPTGNMTGLKGYAVYQSGKWLVSKQTICGLFSLASNGITLSGC